VGRGVRMDLLLDLLVFVLDVLLSGWIDRLHRA
jgi:hypothetical protein